MLSVLTLDQARRNNLKNYLDEHRSDFKSLTDFAKYIGVYVSNLSPILNGDKRFTDKLAETIEDKLSMPRGFLSSLSKAESLLIPFYKFNSKFKSEKDVLKEVGEYLELNRSIIHQDHRDVNSLFAIKPDVSIGRDAMNKIISEEKILIFDGCDTQLRNSKIYLILFYGNIFLRRCKVELDNIFLESDKPEIYSKIIYGNKDVIILGRLLYSANLENY